MIDYEGKRKAAAEALQHRLADLMDDAGINSKVLANAIGVTYSSINNIKSGKTEPGFTLLVLLADYFAVPLDYLTGRCSLQTAEDVLKNYPERFQVLRRAAYEEYLGLRKYIRIPLGYESPWPYNLVESVRMHYAEEVLREDQLRGLDKAIDSLSERERDSILCYYRDGFTLQQIGDRWGVTPQRVRQVLEKAVRKLRHPARQKLVLEGYDIVEEKAKIEKRKAELKAEEDSLNQLADALMAKRLRLCGLHHDLEALIKWDSELRDVRGETPTMDVPIENLDLTVRAYHALHRAGFRTLGQVIDAEAAGNLKGIRLLGPKSYDEVLGRCKWFLENTPIYENKGRGGER
ncbi:MAG: sigma-70 family RNA polymerase sigma factor [Ruminococcaceae bacterium]|nr:sigma-70 family RNA polymerase sigma factor [Oscillospiraceae bacterium]